HTFYAVATDGGGLTSNVATATSQVTEPETGLKFDFGIPGSPVEAGYLPVAGAVGPGATLYGEGLGYGYLPGSNHEGRDRSAGSALLRDLNIGTDSTFVVDLPAAVYEVKLLIGDPWYAHDEVAVELEGAQVDVVTTTVGQTATRIYQVQVLDGQLTVRVRDLGGSDPNAAVQGLEVRAVGPVNSAPTISALTATPDPVEAPAELTLTAVGASDADGAVTSVAFYRESNGVPGL